MKSRPYLTRISLAVLILSAFLAYGTTAYCVPASPFSSEVTQADGTKVKVHIKGDEWQHHVETTGGFTIEKNDKDHNWYYVDHYDKGKPVLSNTPAHLGPPSGLRKGIRQDIQPQRLNLNAPSGSSLSLSVSGSSGTGSATVSASSSNLSPPVGSFNGKVLIILASFSNRAGTYSEAQFANYLTQISTYYNTVTYGNVKLSPATETYALNNGTANDGVVGWLNLGYNYPNTLSSNQTTANTAVQQIAHDAITAAEPYVDFASFDTNHDGYVDSTELAILIVVAGYEASYDNSTPAIWANTWNLGAYVPVVTVNGVTVGSGHNGLSYSEIGEMQGSHMATVGVSAHELGHEMFQYPDLYDTSGNTEGDGDYSLMAAGSWGTSNSDTYYGQTPVAIDAYLKRKSGWITPVAGASSVSLEAVGDTSANATNTAAIINTSASNEFFLFENRGDFGYDRGFERLIPGFTGGLAIWHVDTNKDTGSYAANNTVNTEACYPPNNCATTHYMLALEQADGHWDLENSTTTYLYDNRGDTGDLYPGSTNNTIFNSTSTPNSNMYSGASSGVHISAVSSPSSSITIHFNDNPVTTASATGYAFGAWSNSASVAVTLIANDLSGLGIAAGYPKYCVDSSNACTPSTSYSGALDVTCASGSACTQYVRYFAQDNDGDTESVKSSTVRQDLQAPATTPSATGYAFGNWSSSASISVTLSASDGAGSGVASGYPRYCIDSSNACTPSTPYSVALNVTCPAGGVCTQYVRYYAQDTQGNAEAVKSSTVNQDLQPPVTTATPSGYAFGSWGSSGSISITLSSDDGAGSGVASGYPRYCVDTANTCTPVTAYSVPFNVTCASGSLCTQYVRYFARDVASINEAVKSSVVKQDGQPPATSASSAGYTFGTISHSGSVGVTLAASDGAGSGVAAGYPVYCVDITNTCAPGTAYSGAISVTCAAGIACTQYARYYSVDNAGNAEATKSSAVIQTVPLEVGSVSINNGATYTTSKSVSLRLYATDNVPITGYYKSNSATPPGAKANWKSVTPATIINTTVSHKLAGTAGTNTVYVWFKDSAGSISAVASDSIIYDKSAPVNGTVAATPGNGLVQLAWSGYSDALSNIAGYKIAFATGKKAPKNCSNAQFTTTDTSYAHTGLTMGKKYSYRVCAVNGAGKVSKGATKSATVKADLVGTWVMHEINTDGISNTIGTWSGAQFAVNSASAVACSSYRDGTGGASCSAFEGGSGLMLNPDGTLHIAASSGGGLIKKTNNMMAWVATDGSSGLDMMLLTKLGASYSIANAAGTWVGYGINADPNYAKWYGLGQIINSTGAAACTGYADSNGGTDCADWGIGNYPIMTNGVVNGIVNGTGVMNANKDVMTVVRSAPTGGYELAVLTKAGGTFAQADMAGTWMAYGIKVSADAPLWYYVKQTIDSLGNATCVAYQDSAGVTDCGGWNGLAYLLGTDGAITGLSSGGGVMNPGKDMMTWVTDDGAGGYDLIIFERMQ